VLYPGVAQVEVYDPGFGIGGAAFGWRFAIPEGSWQE